MVKNNVFLSIHYLTLFVPVYTCEMFDCHRCDPHGLQICVDLTRETFLVGQEKKEVAKYIFLKPECINAQYFEGT